MENTLRDSQLASLGKLLAGYTHELKNHLAIINESSGLMGDLLDMSGGEDDKTRQRFKKIIATISVRISQANSMAKILNNLAHHMDLPSSVFHVNTLLLDELALIERFARLKSISFDRNLQEDLPSIFNNPSLLQFILFSLVSDLLGRLDSDSTIKFSTLQQGEDIEILIETIGECSPAAGAGDSENMSEVLNFAAEKMNIFFSQETLAGNQLKTTLTLPGV